MWNLNLKKKKTVQTTEKVQELINEKLVLVFLIFEVELTRNFNEEVSEVIFGNKVLNFQDYNAQTIGIVLLWVTAGFTLYTGYGYLVKGIDHALNEDERS